MSKIQETAVAIRDCLRIQKMADERAIYLRSLDPTSRDFDGPMLGVLADNAQQVCSDAGFLVHTYEQELTAYEPETPEEMLTLMLVICDYFHSHDLAEGSDAETVVRLLLGRVLGGLVGMVGVESSPLSEGYYNPSRFWACRVCELEKPLLPRSSVEPSEAA